MGERAATSLSGRRRRAAPDLAGRRRAEMVMGLPVAIDVRDRELDPRALDRAFAWLREVDARFSTYDRASEISRLGRGELALGDAHPHVREVLSLCEALRVRTEGYFDAGTPLRGPAAISGGSRAGLLPRRPPDPTGLVKGWAADRLVEGLEAAGARDFCVDLGGDLLVRGGSAPGRTWRVGIRHPREPDRVAAVLALSDAAVATSGAYERGAHIVDPHTGRSPSGVLAVTVVGSDLATADALATALFAMGRRGPAWAARHPGLAAMIVLAGDPAPRASSAASVAAGDPARPASSVATVPAGDHVLSTPAFVARCAGASVADSLRVPSAA